MSEVLYLTVENNVVTDMVTWDGDTNVWYPPENVLLLPLLTTLARTWVLNSDNTEYVLEDIIGRGSIGYTWDGTILTTNQTEPPPINASEITTTGTQSA